MPAKRLHIIINSHMDPIWLWTLREGRATWLNTCRSVVEMLHRHPELKFTRSSTAAYRWIEACDPGLFRAVTELVRAGRWEPVGGWIEQSDTVYAPGESLLRQAEQGKAYFQEKFGMDVRIGYSVDSFGQNIGLPTILRHSGLDYYVFQRPDRHEKELPCLFRWRGPDGSEVLTLRVFSYCQGAQISREAFFSSLKMHVELGEEDQTFFFGVGDHGGGISERHLQWLFEARQGYDITFSTLTEYFARLRPASLPVITGELNPHAPGCYSAVQMIKAEQIRGERLLLHAERTLLESPDTADLTADEAALKTAWEDHLFNYFHDVFPGTCTGKSYRQEIRDISGFAARIATNVLEKGLFRHGCAADTSFMREGGILVRNNSSGTANGIVRFDTFSDPNSTGRRFNALRSADGTLLPLQWCCAAASFGPCNAPWDKLCAVVPLGGGEMRLLAYTHTDQEFPALGFEPQYRLLQRLSLTLLQDGYDTWGHGATALGTEIAALRPEGTQELENGPICSSLRALFYWKSSRVKLDLTAWRNQSELELTVRFDWRETGETVKLAIDCGAISGGILSGQALADIRREPDQCEHAFIDYVVATGSKGRIGVFADSLHGYDCNASWEKLRITLLRPVAYTVHRPFPEHGDEGHADLGESEVVFFLHESAIDPKQDDSAFFATRSRLLLANAETVEVTRHAPACAPYRFTRYEVEGTGIVVESQRRSGDAVCFHLRNAGSKPTVYRIKRNAELIADGTLPAFSFAEIRTEGLRTPR